jgi:hypothetical protein
MMKLIGATVPHCIISILFGGIVSASANTPLDGLKQFILDTMDHFGSRTPVFVTRSDTCCCSEMASIVASVHLCYEKDFEAIDILKIIRSLYDLNELNIIFFLGNGHEELLRMRTEDFNLLSSGVTLVLSYEPNPSYIKLRLDSKLFFFTELIEEIIISEMYSIKLGPLIKRKIGIWTIETGLVVYTPNIWERRADLLGTPLECVTLDSGYITQVQHDSQNGNFTHVTGLFPDYLKLLENHLNFTVNVGLSVDGKWGAPEKDGSTWNGIVGMLINNEADIETGGLTRTFQRAEVIDFGVTLELDIATLVQPRSVIYFPSSLSTCVKLIVCVKFNIFYQVYFRFIWLN